MEKHNYLHSDLLANPNNDKVFQETYEVIRLISWRMAEIYGQSLNLSPRQREEYQDVFLNDNEELIVNLVNYTIHHFEK